MMPFSATNNTIKYEDLEGSVCSKLFSFVSRVSIQILKQVKTVNSIATYALSELVRVPGKLVLITYKMSHDKFLPS